MNANIALLTEQDKRKWDEYVLNHPFSNLYHLSNWKDVIEKAYHHQTYYLFSSRNGKSVAGVLPMVHLKHFLFGNRLLSMPYFDMGGALSDDVSLEKSLLEESIQLGCRLKADSIELRNSKDSWLNVEGTSFLPAQTTGERPSLITRSHKERMILKLPESTELLWKSFKSKLRSQIRKPIKVGLQAKIGGQELLDDFKRVFIVNMRDLGSPVHSHKIMEQTLSQFEQTSRIVIIYYDNKPVACSLIVGFKDTMENPWASSLREYGRFSPNMLLYWKMLEYACDNGYTSFDFGRASPDEGTYKFKKQWGAESFPLYWHYINLKKKTSADSVSEKTEFQRAAQIWKKLPVQVTSILGPRIRKHIGL